MSRNITVTGARMVLTADIGPSGGSVVIGVVGHGAALQSSAPITTTCTNCAVVFPDAPGALDGLVGTVVQLRVVLSNATLYTVGFDAP